MPRLCIVSTTMSDAAAATSLAEAVIKARLGACVQTSEVVSRYEWEGKLCSEPEVLLQIKTTEECAAKLQSFIVARHSYKVPEILVVTVAAASSAYAEWVATQVGEGKILCA